MGDVALGSRVHLEVLALETTLVRSIESTLPAHCLERAHRSRREQQRSEMIACGTTAARWPAEAPLMATLPGIVVRKPRDGTKSLHNPSRHRKPVGNDSDPGGWQMRYGIEQIEGIGPAYGHKLRAAGIRSTTALLKAAADPAGRKKLEADTGIDHGRILAWANMADLMRINGVGKQFAELLEAAGVDTVKELKMRNAANLAERMGEVNAAKKLTRVVPAESMIAKWIAEAKDLAPILTY